MTLALDHLVIATPSLAEGVAWCERTLGITPGPGGRHDRFGTHNRLFGIGSAAFPRCYFEVIAIDPEAPAPARARWFGLDAAPRTTRLLHWVARSEDLQADRQRLVDAGVDPGEVIEASRETPQGRLEWRIVVRSDGALIARGALPTLIGWGRVHPADSMPASGVALIGLELGGLDAAVSAALDLPGVTLRPGAGPALRARLATPRGEVILESE